MQDLLSFVQTHARSKRENLAGEVLAHLLREEAGQTVLRSLIKGLSNTSEDFIEVVTQRKSADCIPDLRLIQKEKPVGLLELKFGAPLTHDQLSGTYFKIAPEVVFVAPEDRVLSLRSRLANLSSKHLLSVVSWTDLLGQLESANGTSDTRDERLFAGALEHLKEFCNVIEQERFEAFTDSQLRTPIHDVHIQHLVWLTKEILTNATKEQIIQEAGRLGAGFDGNFFYGQNVLLGDYRVWLGYWPYAWKRSSANGPLWVQFYGTQAKPLLESGCFTDGIRLASNDIAFSLLTSSSGSFTSQEEEVASALASLKKLAARLSEIQTVPLA